MAEGKKSFVLYSDQRGVFDKLSDEQAGILIKHIFGYVNDEKPKGDFITELAFESIKQQLKRDLVKYEVRADRSRTNGKLGGRPKNPEKPTEPSGLNNNLDEPRKPDNVTVTVTGNVNDTVTEKKTMPVRKIEFSTSVEEFKDEFSNEMIGEFIGYWTEHNEKGKLMRFEMKKNQPFNIKRRLSTWKSRQNNGTQSSKSSSGSARTTTSTVQEYK